MARAYLEGLSVVIYPGPVFDAIAAHDWNPWVDEKLDAEIVRVFKPNHECTPAQPYFRFTLVKRGGGVGSLPNEIPYIHRMLAFKQWLLEATGAVHDAQAQTSILEC